MIQADQPDCFGGGVIAAVSSAEDGQIQLGKGEPDSEVIANRRVFLEKADLEIDRTVLLRVTFSEDRGYDIIREVDSGDASKGMYDNNDVSAADCLVTQATGVGLFLPIADCNGVIVHDPVKKVIALAHLGRHSTTAQLAEKLVAFLHKKYGSQPNDLVVWFSPSIRQPSYRVLAEHAKNGDPRIDEYLKEDKEGYWFDTQGYNRRQFVDSGVKEDSIHDEGINTATHPEYSSHYTEYTVGKKQPPARFAVVCALT